MHVLWIKTHNATQEVGAAHIINMYPQFHIHLKKTFIVEISSSYTNVILVLQAS